MGIEAISPVKDSSHNTFRQKHKRWLVLQPSPLWLCLLLAVIVRVWLVVHTHGVIDGDEAIVGIQAQHILRGEVPIYYYAQQYMGSLEAYLIAFLFALAGASVWTLRAEPILLSLFVVWLTWRLASALAETAQLTPYTRRTFMTIAALFAAVPPLYDSVIELRLLGGYIEAFVIMQMLLLSALRLTQRWHTGVSSRELAWRWTGLGILVGLGLWVNPLIISAVLAAAIWIVGYCLTEIVKRRRQTVIESWRSVFSPLKDLRLAVTAIPASLIGFAPAIYWGATNHWRNITYIVNNGGQLSRHRLATIYHVLNLYRTCIAPRIIGGALPEVNITSTEPGIFTLGLVIGSFFLLVTVIPFGLSFFWHHPLLLLMRQLISLPLLFGICTAFIFCISNISAVGLDAPCSTIDLVGRYASPLLLALPFIFATAFTIMSMYRQEIGTSIAQFQNGDGSSSQPSSSPVLSRPSFSRVKKIFAVLLLLLCILGYTYVQTSAGYTFQTSGCVVAPANNDPIIAYMQRKHIHHAWASFWIGNPIIFKTNGSIIVADPRIITTPRIFKSRIAAFTDAVVHAVRPSVLTLVHSNDLYPLLLQRLDTEQVTYQVMRFPTEPGVDLLVVTPLSRAISPFESHSLGASFGGC